MVNLDMVGRLREDPKTQKEKLLVEGTGTSKAFDKLVEDLNPGFQYSKKAGVSPFSDHDSFYRKKIPVIFYWTNVHEDYHKPSDTSDKINVPGMRKITDLAEKTISRLVTVKERPDYIAVASSFKPTPVGKMARLGIMPNYEEERPGVVVGGLTDDSPAAKGGLKVGGLIVGIAGKQGNHNNKYMAIMGPQTPRQN